MSPKKRHRSISRIGKKFKFLTAAVAGTAIISGLSSTLAPPATVHASADPTNHNAPVASTQQV